MTPRRAARNEFEQAQRLRTDLKHVRNTISIACIVRKNGAGSNATLAILEMVRPLAVMRDGEPDPTAPVFPGPRRALSMSNMVLLMMLRQSYADNPTFRHSHGALYTIGSLMW